MSIPSHLTVFNVLYIYDYICFLSHKIVHLEISFFSCLKLVNSKYSITVLKELTLITGFISVFLCV